MLVTEIKKVVSSCCQGLSPDAQLKDLRPDLCHTFVVSSRLRATGCAIRMRTYDTLTEDAFPACIWQAVRATSAALTFFPFILIDDDRYGDGDTD